jgi:hypothetical protein
MATLLNSYSASLADLTPQTALGLKDFVPVALEVIMATDVIATTVDSGQEPRRVHQLQGNPGRSAYAPQGRNQLNSRTWLSEMFQTANAVSMVHQYHDSGPALQDVLSVSSGVHHHRRR